MSFERQKKTALNNLEASLNVGDVDPALKPLLEAINSFDRYYSTSSCSGRVALLQDIKGKGECRFLGKWHRRATSDEVLRVLKPCDGVVWFRYESPILHVIARDIKAASELLKACRSAGFKRSGIQSMKEERLMVEVLSTERLDAPVMADGITLVSDEYIRYLVGQANLKYDRGSSKLDKLLECLKSVQAAI
ncbi:MAG: hypothetical protein GF416_01085 [Candidatus Altiarchaeales archaeon]|nr:hypothetical protein [Candidatus Altiarchaeales archaeon]MBD3415710.1 hypothetical protein [Candidatus Altiarchaeales archaeon]